MRLILKLAADSRKPAVMWTESVQSCGSDRRSRRTPRHCRNLLGDAALFRGNTFAGITPHDVPFFIVAQLFGAACAGVLARWLLTPES